MDIPKELLSKEFLNQFKIADEVDAFLCKFHTHIYEQILEGEMDNHLGYEKHSPDGNNTGNSHNGKYQKIIQNEYGEATLNVPRNRSGNFGGNDAQR